VAVERAERERRAAFFLATGAAVGLNTARTRSIAARAFNGPANRAEGFQMDGGGSGTPARTTKNSWLAS
jgi:hypothetical protein